MPCFNYVRYVEESIKSVLNSTERDLELIVVDDGSTDGSREVIGRIASLDKRLKPLYHTRNLGVSTARNDALKIASGEYIAFCDADDVWLPGKLASQLQLLSEHPRADIAYCDARIIDDAGRETGALFSHRFPVPGSGSGDLLKTLCVRNFINTQSVLLRRECLSEESYFNPAIRWGEDWLFWLKLAPQVSFSYSPEPLCLYRVHAASSFASAGEGAIRDRIKIYLEALHFIDLLPRQVVSEVFYHLGVACARLKEEKEEDRRFNSYSAKQSYVFALRLNPFNWKAAVRLILSYAHP